VAFSAVWDETQPLGTALASTLDNIIRDLKRDLRERLVLEHIWDITDNSGKHKNITLNAPVDAWQIQTGVANSITGNISAGIMKLDQTWNTTANCFGIALNVIPTATGAASMLLLLAVNGVTKFAVDMSGIIVIGGITGTSTPGNVNSSAPFTADNQLIRSDGTARNVKSSGILVSDLGDFTGVRVMTYAFSNSMRQQALSVNSVYTALSDGFVAVIGNAVAGNWVGSFSVLSDGAAIPTTVVARAYMNSGIALYNQVCVPVPLGFRFQVTTEVSQGTPAIGILWYPLGPGGVI